MKTETKIEIKSTKIDYLCYDQNIQDLTVKFENGILYTYRDVPMKIIRRLKKTSEPERFLNRNIKGTYHYIRSHE